MKKIADFLIRQKIAVIVLIVVMAVACYFLDSKVGINYNLSDYLDDETDTKIALQLMEQEFGLTGNMQVMVSDISAEQAEKLVKRFDDVDSVLNVNFDADDENYYKAGDALFVILIDGDDYSADAEQVITDVKQIVSEEGLANVQYGGTAVEKANLKGSITNEILYILVICIALAYVILTVTTGSWLEPILFLLTAGIAILLNRGTNLIFGKISYITNSIAAILQLALAMDYSIMLLHSYHRKHTQIGEPRVAMSEAVAECLRPVSASALTTIAGLLALLFMTFSIGFDIGIVLMKGIVLSFLVAFTLFPCVIVLFAKILDKTRLRIGKKTEHNTGRNNRIASFSRKCKTVVVPAFCLLIIGAFILQGSNTFIFSDSKAANNTIVDEFGNTNTLLLLYSNNHTDADQDAFIRELSQYTDAEGKPVLKNYKSYTNTVMEQYDINKAAKKMDISKADAQMLLSMYNLYQQPDSYTLTLRRFIAEAIDLIQNDADAKNLVDENAALTLQRLQAIYDVTEQNYTAWELCDAMTSDTLKGYTNLDSFAVNQIYSLCAYSGISNPNVPFTTMLQYIIYAAENNSRVSSMISSSTVKDLKALQAGIQQFTSEAERSLTAEEFQAVMSEKYGVTISLPVVRMLYNAYGSSSIRLLDMLNYMDTQGYITDASMQSTLRAQNAAYKAIHQSYGYNEFLQAASSIATGLGASASSVTADNDAMQMLYIFYFTDKGMVPIIRMTGKEFALRTLDLANNNSVVKSLITGTQKGQLHDMLEISKALSDEQEYSFPDMQKQFEELQESIVSYKSEEGISTDKAAGVFIKSMIKEEKNSKDPIAAKTLLDFIEQNMDTNELLKERMTDARRQKVEEARSEVNQATDLLVDETYTRVIMSINLPNESPDSYQFSKDVKAMAQKYFGDDAHLAGEILSVDDLRESFDHDQTLISIFTVISILLIVLATFRSLSIPVILVAIIQGSIWIAMSLFAVIDFNVFFMSYIVATCILMGATIDYGILLSSNYVTNRQGMDRFEALKAAVGAAIPTVASSGLVLMCCGFVIRLVSTENSISTTGLLLGVGTFCSVIMVLFVLPSVLYLCDKIIMKTTMKSKKN